ncbi:hypothetical protein PDIG_53400 [Penicillium digitatum PHI26]|uniref:Uncharacterized protein n=2 Tax=Penicillium digitatum TaxID=36651 RepID=K9FR61_PEND2|nr:hypothetical protein PDIP_48620 [Penicillium digitatum Pd1]EKV10852.1 hypothetical protein PDIG_53400 [Penicillium digitatum PHI26]EKV13369.1 hypothetical protein PDIP_48620 [Penicillium digitatum Pd1]
MGDIGKAGRLNGVRSTIYSVETGTSSRTKKPSELVCRPQWRG